LKDEQITEQHKHLDFVKNYFNKNSDVQLVQDDLSIFNIEPNFVFHDTFLDELLESENINFEQKKSGNVVKGYKVKKLYKVYNKQNGSIFNNYFHNRGINSLMAEYMGNESKLKIKQHIQNIKSLDNNKFLIEGNFIEANELKNCTFQIDTGSKYNLLSIKWLKTHFPHYLHYTDPVALDVILVDVQGKPLHITDTRTFRLNIKGLGGCNITFIIHGGEANLLGMEFLSQFQASLHFNENSQFIYFGKKWQRPIKAQESKLFLGKEIYIPPGEIVTAVLPVNFKKRSQLIVLNEPSMLLAVLPQLCIVKIRRKQCQIKFQLHNPRGEGVVLPAGYQILVERCLNKKDNFSIKTLLPDTKVSWQECINIVNEKGIFFERFPHNHNMNNVEAELFDGYYAQPIDVVNFIDNLHTIEIENDPPEDLNSDLKQSNFELPEVESGGGNLPFEEDTYDNLDEKLKNYSENMQAYLKKTFKNYNAESLHPWDCGETEIEVDMPLKKPVPRSTFVYPLSQEDRNHVKHILDYLLFYKLIERCGPNEQYGSPSFLICNKSSGKIRLLVDSRRYNECLSGTKSALMCSIFSHIRGIASNAKYASSLDLTAAYWGLKLSKKTIASGVGNFTTPFGAYRFLRGISGSAATPAWFGQFMIDKLHQNHNGEPDPLINCFNFYDDVSVITQQFESLDDHLLQLTTIISRIHKMGLKINLLKSKFAVDLTKDKIKILGYDLSSDGISIPPEKLDALKHMVAPKSVKELQVLLGKLQYFRGILGLGTLNSMAVLSSKISKNKLIWDEEANTVFMQIKQAMQADRIVMSSPRPNSLNILSTDASDYAVGAILMNIELKYLDVQHDVNEAMVWQEVQDLPLIEHIHRFKLPIKAISNGNSFENLCTKAYNLFSDNSEQLNWQEVKNKLLTLGFYTAPYYTYCLQNESNVGGDHQNFTTFVKKIRENVEENLVNFEDFLLRSLSGVLERQILLIIHGLRPMKTAFIKIGSPGYKTPILISYNVLSKLYNMLGFTMDFELYRATNTIYEEKYTTTEIVNSFYKVLKSKDNSILEKVAIVGYYSKSLTPAQKRRPVYCREGFGIIQGLEFFKDDIRVNPTILLTDNSPIKDIFSAHLFIKNKYVSALGLSLIENFPQVRILCVKGFAMLADFFSRISPSTNMENKKLSFGVGKPLITDSGEEIGYMYNNFEEIANKYADVESINLIAAKNIENIFGKFLSVNQIKLQQRHDFEDIISCIDNGTHATFMDRNGLIIERAEPNRILLPRSLFHVAVAYAHYYHKHGGVKAIYRTMLKLYTVINKTELKNAVKLITECCLSCCSSKPGQYQNLLGSAYEKITAKSQMITMDLMEGSTSHNHKIANLYTNNILVIRDVFTRFLTIFFLHKKTEKEIILSLLNYFSEHSVPQAILSDNAPIFRAAGFKKLLSFFSVKLIESSVRRSESRGIAERAIRTLRQGVRTENSSLTSLNYPILLVDLVYKLNRLPLAGLQVSPYNLHYENFHNQGPNTQNQVAGKDIEFILESESSLTEKKELVSEIIARNNALLKEIPLKKLKKLNEKRKAFKAISGNYCLIKNYRDSLNEKSFQTLYHREIYVILKARKYTCVLQNVVTKVILSRHYSHIKVLNYENVKQLKLPQELLTELDLLTLEDFLPRVKDSSPVSVGGAMTRFRTLQENKIIDNEYEDDDDDLQVWFDE